MLRRTMVLALVVLGSRAAAEEVVDRVQGFSAPGVGEVSGRVTDADGNGVKNATVHVVTKRGERTVTTDREGRYKTNVDDKATLIVVYGDARISGSAVTTQVVDGLETIELKDALPPAKFAKALTDHTIIPEYTDEMMDKNAWARAWLLLEVNDAGVVSRVKLINPPGFALDAIAVRDAFKLKFEPARDRSDKPVRSQMLWTFEWPAFWWMKDGRFPLRKIPREAYRVRCRGTGPTHDVYRDCSPPNLSAALANRWITK